MKQTNQNRFRKHAFNLMRKRWFKSADYKRIGKLKGINPAMVHARIMERMATDALTLPIKQFTSITFKSYLTNYRHGKTN